MNIYFNKHEVYDLDDALMIIPYVDNTLDVAHVAYLEKVSLVIWSYLKDGISEAAVVDKVAKQYGVSYPSVEEDIHSFIMALVEIGIVEYR